MRTTSLVSQLVTACLLICTVSSVRYEPNWASIDSRPLPGWYDDVKFGIFIHWGVFSVPSVGYGEWGAGEWFWWYWEGLQNPDYVKFMQQNYPPGFSYQDFAPSLKAEFFDPDEWAEILESSGANTGDSGTSQASGEWFWWLWEGQNVPQYVDFMNKNYRPGFSYEDFAPQFKAEFYDPDRWADIFQSSGARYVVLTSKHHEGFTNWPSPVSWNWNSVDVGPHRNLVADLASSIRQKTNLHFGLYHSLFEWFHPLYLKDKSNNFSTQEFVARKTMPELYEIVNAYKPEVIWSDGDWEAMSEYWNSTEFIAWLYNDSPVKDVVVTNDRWGKDATCHHGGFLTCQDRYNPGTLATRKFENAMTIDKYSWGYRRNAVLSDFLTIEEILSTLVITVSTGGNMLMNVGPTADGRIAPIFEERLRQTGEWLAVNGEAIYSTKPWKYQNDTVTTDVWYTSGKPPSTSVYAIVFNWPKTNQLYLGAPTTVTNTVVTLVGYQGTFTWKASSPQGITIDIPIIPANKLPCKWTWVFKLHNLQ